MEHVYAREGLYIENGIDALLVQFTIAITNCIFKAIE